MSAYCSGCGVQIDEDDRRDCPNCRHAKSLSLVEIDRVLRDAAILGAECRAWRDLYGSYDALKPAEVDDTDDSGALERRYPYFPPSGEIKR